MAIAKILLVDDDELARATLRQDLEQNGFVVTTAPTVTEALEHISSARYDVILSNLIVPDDRDGDSVVGTMRNNNPGDVTLVFTGNPGAGVAAQVVRAQFDEIFASPTDLISLVRGIKDGAIDEPLQARSTESVAMILDRETQSAVQEWYKRAQLVPELMAVPMNREVRCAYLAQMFRDLVVRLRSQSPADGKLRASVAAAQHGIDRRNQGYTAAMMVEESRMLQVTIFHTLHKHLNSIDCSVLLLGVMAIADECDSQLAQAMSSYVDGASSESAKLPQEPLI
jgi:CheY-like chemotaxis protein